MFRKLLIGASAIALMTGVAQAQNLGTQGDAGTAAYFPGAQPAGDSSSVTQTGNNNTANVDQTGGSHSESTVKQGIASQVSGNNQADIDQNGTGANRAYVEQISSNLSNLGFPGATPAGIPAGKQQEAIVNQTNNGAGVNQAVILQGQPNAGGILDYAKVDQNGTGNKGGIQQGALSGGAGPEVDGRMEGTIAQTGDNNTAETVQGEIDVAHTTQTGNSNQAYVNQSPTDVGGSDRLGRLSNVTQIGNQNLANVTQYGTYSKSAVAQTGNQNTATVTQDRAGGVWSASTSPVSDSNVAQTGDRNTATVAQNDTSKSNVEQGNKPSIVSTDNLADVKQLAGSNNSFSDINQNGLRNKTYISQAGANSDSFAYITGNDNKAHVQQEASGNVSLLFQYVETYGGELPTTSATNNTANVLQTATSTDSYSYVAQTGDGNYARVILSGAGESTTGRHPDSEGYALNEPAESQVWQLGNTNTALVDQAAAHADSTVYQGITMGDGSYESEAYKLSANNTANVTQTAGAFNASSNIYQGGFTNSATVYQSGANALANIWQNGNNNTASTTQSQANTNSLTKQVGDSNSASVFQLVNAGAVSTVNQLGNNNSTTVNQ